MPHTTPSLLVFAGSTRQQSFNRKLAHATAAIARDAGASVTLLELSDFDIPLYNADLEAQGTPADVIRLKEILWQHPAWVIHEPGPHTLHFLEGGQERGLALGVDPCLEAGLGQPLGRFLQFGFPLLLHPFVLGC